MKKQEKPSRVALTLLCSIVVFIILLITMIIVAAIFLILVKLGLFADLAYQPSTDIIIVLIAIASTVIGTGLTFFASKIPLKPANKLINAMNRLSKGDFSTRIGFRKFALGKEIADSFNTMASELQKTEQLRSEFINNFSHEFKTPIVSIAGFAKLLKKGNVTEEQRQEYLSIIEEESLRLSQMATAVLNLTKIENQEILTDVKNYNLSEQIRTCILMLEEKWAEKNLNLIVNFDEYDIEANEDMLKQVWLNLIDNAIKFVPENGTVEVSVQTEEKHIKVCVFNSGSFVPEESRDKIFNKFYQADESHYSHGNGIGLAVAKKIIELHKGEIQVFSDDKGTYFTVILTV